MTRLREEHKKDYWAEYWTEMDVDRRALQMEFYLKSHPDYVDDGGVPPYDEELLPQGSGDVVQRWVWKHYGIPDLLEHYCNTLTGYHKTMAYSFFGFQYFFLDGTPWDAPEEAYVDASCYDGMEFWRFLPSDD